MLGVVAVGRFEETCLKRRDPSIRTDVEAFGFGELAVRESDLQVIAHQRRDLGTVGVRDAARALAEKGVIRDETASAMTDLSAQYQYMYRTTTNRSEYLNENVVGAYSKTAAHVRQSLKSGQ